MMLKKTINFAQYSSFKIGPSCEVMLYDETIHDYQEYYLIGGCNNTLVGNTPPPLMMLSKRYDFIKQKGGVLTIGGATPSGKIASYCKKNNIANFEFLSHLPGKLGGLVFMNAGLKEYEIFNHLLFVRTPLKTYAKDEIIFGYRYTNIDEPILEVGFELEFGFEPAKVQMFREMRANQPSTPSAGSCFKNPKNDYAGRLIEAVGLKGVLKGDICFSPRHANFLVNNGRGRFEDALFLINEAKKRVDESFGISLECEIIILDKEYPQQTQ